MNTAKKLIINADDYGICPEVNAAVEQLAGAGLLGGVSVLANGACWREAVGFLRDHAETAELSAGVHLNLIEGHPISDSSKIEILLDQNSELAGRTEIFKRWMLHPMAVRRAVEIEWRAQVERLQQAKIRLVHADSHQHLHAFPPFWRCATGLCQEYGIPALRRPDERAGQPHHSRLAAGYALNASLRVARRLTPNSGLFHNDHFLGFQRAGDYDFAKLTTDLQRLRPGVTELALHPSLRDHTPDSDLRGNVERLTLLDPRFRQLVEGLEIALTNWMIQVS